MKKKLMILLMQLCFIGIVINLPVLIQVNGSNGELLLTLKDMSWQKTNILLMTLIVAVCLEKAKYYRLACIVNGILIPYVGWLLFIAHTYANEYTRGKQTMVCNYSMYVFLFAFLFGNIYLCEKMKREGKEEKQKHILCCLSHIRITAIVTCCIIFIFGMISYNEIIEAKSIENRDYDIHCSMGRVVFEVKDFDKQEMVYKDNKKIKIRYEVTCLDAESYYLYLPNDDNIKFYTKDKQKVSDRDEIDIEFKVEKDGVNEIEFTIMTDSQTPEIEMKFYIYTYTADGMTFVDFNCVEDAEEAYYEWLLEKGEIELEEYYRIIEEKHTLKEEDGSVEVDIVESMQRTSSSNITVKGKVQWQDTNGVYHGANEIRVEVYDEDTVIDDLITAVYTDSNGNYSVTLKNDTSILEDGYDIFIEIYARGRYVSVVDSDDEIYYVKKKLCDNANNGATITGDVKLSNGATTYRAFQVQQAASMASYYMYKIRGSYLENVKVKYPDSSKSVSHYNNSNIYLLSGDYCDWDVIQHEYGHHVAHKLGFNKSEGGNHSVGVNSCDLLKNKDKGIKQAWSEGWATYFPIVLQQNMSGKTMMIPQVGDLFYTNSLNSTLNVSVEKPSFPCGEGDGLAVAAALWDITDSGDTEAWDKLELGFSSVYNYIVSNKCATLSEFIQKVQSVSGNRELRVGDILSSVDISCKNTRVQFYSTPKFIWQGVYSSADYRKWSYSLVLYNLSYVKIMEIPIQTNVESYTLTSSEWSKLRSMVSTGKTVYWAVKATEKSYPATGPYYSKSGSFIMP